MPWQFSESDPVSVASIEAFYKAHTDLIEFLIENGQPTFASDTTDNFRRSLVLAVASFFETEISAIVRALPARHADGNAFLTALVDQKAVTRQYHGYFDWDKTNANKFFSMFGPEYKAACQKKVEAEPDFQAGVRAFLSLGDTRNRIAHLNYVEFTVDKTPNDIITEFRSAMKFVDYVRSTLLPPKPPAPADVDAPTHPAA